MEAKQINLSEWESFGGGGYGESFYNKTDDSVILKLNKTSVSAQKAQEEFRRILHMDRSMLRRFYEAFKKQYFGQSWNSPELREKMDRIGHIQAAKVMYTWPSANHLNLPFLQGKKLKTALNLVIGDHMKLE